MTYSAVNTIWVLIGAALVFFMQAGFYNFNEGLTSGTGIINVFGVDLGDGVGRHIGCAGDCRTDDVLASHTCAGVAVEGEA